MGMAKVKDMFDTMKERIRAQISDTYNAVQFTINNKQGESTLSLPSFSFTTST